MSQVIEIRDLILYELKCFREELKKEVQKLEKKLIHIVSSMQNGQVEDSSEINCSKEISKVSQVSVAQLLKSENTNSVLANSGILNSTEVIDLSDYFDYLEVPQQTSSLPEQSNDDQVSSSQISNENVDPSKLELNSVAYEKCAHYPHVESSEYIDSKSLVKTYIKNDSDSDVAVATTINEESSDDESIVVVSRIKNKAPKNHVDKINNAVEVCQSSTNAQINSNKTSELTVSTSNLDIISFIDPVTGKKMHKCPFCNKNFRHLKDTKRHIHIHTGERPFKCIFCNKGFKRAAHMRCHMRTHTGEKPYKCDKCPKAFCGSGSLSNHKHVHEEKSKKFDPEFEKKMRPYVCTVCDRRFKQKVQRDGHMNSAHLGVKKFSCVVCGRKFARKEHVDRHMRTHTGEKPYKCPFCDNYFADSSTLRKHKINVHS